MYVILFNSFFFVNVANDIGNEIIFDENNHPSIHCIGKNAPKTTLILNQQTQTL